MLAVINSISGSKPILSESVFRRYSLLLQCNGQRTTDHGQMNATLIVGLEVHVQLLTRTKLFCGCVNRFNPDHPNTQTCPVCLGLPGSLPVMNRRAFELALEIGLALHCEIAPFTKWDRKQYYYPDLPKAYQISQYDLPFSHDGWLEVEVPTGKNTEPEIKRVRIIRAHLEEDAGKNMHDETGRGGDSRVDLNRCGTPLVEIVSQPDIRSPQEAKAFLEELRLMLTYLGVSDCNMQEGSLRCDANVNLHIPAERTGTPSPRRLWRSKTSTVFAAWRRRWNLKPTGNGRNIKRPAANWAMPAAKKKPAAGMRTAT